MEFYHAEKTDALTEWGVRNQTRERVEALGIQSFVWAGARLDGSQPRRLHLISRLPHQAYAGDSWLAALRASLDESGGRGEHIIAGADLIGWEYAAWYAARFDLNLWIILPPAPIDKFLTTIENILHQLDLSPEHTVFIQPTLDSIPKKNISLHLRDELALALADRVCPVALRPKGFWAGIYPKLHNLDERFNVGYPPRHQPAWRNWVKDFIAQTDSDSLSPLEFENRDYLFHWTRGVFGPWPGETLADYFRVLTVASSGNPRGAWETLTFIVRSGILRGEGRMLRGREPALSFTALPPAKALARICYRSALGHWNYEPYGLAVPLTSLETLGARPVIYGEREVFYHLSDNLKPYYQYAKDQSSDESPLEDEEAKRPPSETPNAAWRGEQEWRLLGDLD
ncbi:MAG: hypothetical protein V2A61_03115, partial [Calditrichota bacterium]